MSQLADKIGVAVRPARSLALYVVENSSSISPSDVALLSHLLETDLAAGKIRVIQEESPETIVYVRISEGVEGPMVTAQVHRSDEEDSAGQIAIVALQKPIVTNSGEAGIPLILRRKFVFAQAARFVDFTLLGESDGTRTRLVLLEPDRLVYWRSDPPGWSFDRSFPVRSRFHLSRDPRGTIANVDETLHAYLPHDTCVDSLVGETNIECRPNIRSRPSVAAATGESWPLRTDGLWHPSAPYAADRNYFESVTAVFGDAISRLPAFYSSAIERKERGPSWMLAELDRHARLYDFFAAPDATFSGWGDDLVTVDADCEPAWLVLVSGTGDWTARDTLRMYRVTDHQAATVGQPLEFPGPILALWPAEDAKSARVVSRSLQTGMYEASIVSISCGN